MKDKSNVRVQLDAELKELEKKDPIMQQIGLRLLEKFPYISAMVFFGSRVNGIPDERSDYDIFVLMPAGLSWKERGMTEIELKKNMGVKVQFIVSSPGASKFFLRVNPYLRFWLEEGILLGDFKKIVKDAPPLSKQGCIDSVIDLKLDVDDVKVERDLNEKAKSYYSILRRLLIVEQAIEDNYSYVMLMSELETLIGKRLFNTLKSARPVLQKEELHTLEQIIQSRLEDISKKAHSMKENVSDKYLQR